MNSVQKNFRKEMKKSLKEMKKNNKEQYHNYIRKNHLDNPEQRIFNDTKDKIKRGIGGIFKLIFTTVVIIVVLAVAISSFTISKNKNSISNKIENIKKSQTISTLNPTNSNSNQQSIIKYLNDLNTIEANINKDVNLRNNDTNSLNNRLLTRNEYINNLIVYKNRVDANILQITQVPCPKELANYYGITLNTLKALSGGMDFEISYMQTNDLNSKKKAEDFYKIHRDGINSRIAELNGVLDRNNIRHQ